MDDLSFEPVVMPLVASLSAEIAQKRDFGEVVISVCSVRGAELPGDERGDEATDLVDAFVERQGCLGLREDWTRLDRDEARRLLTRILARDLAYNAAIMPLDVAERLARRFLDLFQPPCRFFSNALVSDKVEDLSATLSGGWAPITNARFDTGVVALGGDRVGMLWVKDED